MGFISNIMWVFKTLRLVLINSQKDYAVRQFKKMYEKLSFDKTSHIMQHINLISSKITQTCTVK